MKIGTMNGKLNNFASDDVNDPIWFQKLKLFCLNKTNKKLGPFFLSVCIPKEST